MSADKELAKLLEKQISLTEWIQRIDHKDAIDLAKEDNYKRDRIGQVSEVTGLPYDKPTQFEAKELAERTPKFNNFLSERGDELCALRLIPKPNNSDLPKLRMRGRSIKDVIHWFDEQNIDPENYVADFVPHSSDPSWSTIFIVGNKGIFGEIYFGGHHVLTQGIHAGDAPHVFGYDFYHWSIEPENKEALDYLKQMVNLLKIDDKVKRQKLEKHVNAKFINNYLQGYFETTHSNDSGTWFIDYNRILGERYGDFKFRITKKIVTDAETEVFVSGRTASGGRARGVAVIADSNTSPNDFPTGNILVCEMTSPDYLPLMKKAGAIVTDQGGILCHAAIVARELGKPCIVGTGNATAIIQPGDEVEVNADAGAVLILTAEERPRIL